MIPHRSGTDRSVRTRVRARIDEVMDLRTQLAPLAAPQRSAQTIRLVLLDGALSSAVRTQTGNTAAALQACGRHAAG